MSSKTDKAKLDAGAKEIREAEQEATTEPKPQSEAQSTGKPSWREHNTVHPACEAWPPLTPDQRKALKADLKVGGLKVPIQTREVVGDPTKYVIDGYHRLDLMEELGWQIVDKDGNWMGAALDKVEHQVGRTHKQIGEEVNSYNGKRRHMNKQELLECMHQTRIKARELSNDRTKTARSVKRGAGGRLSGSTKDPDKTEIEKDAEEIGASPRTAKRVHQKIKREAKAAEAAPSTPKPKPSKPEKPERSVKWEVHRWTAKFRKQFKDDGTLPEAQVELVNDLFSHWTGVEQIYDLKSVNLTGNKTCTVREYFKAGSDPLIPLLCKESENHEKEREQRTTGAMGIVGKPPITKKEMMRMVEEEEDEQEEDGDED